MVKQILKEIRIGLTSTLVLAVLVCGIYPMLVWGIAQGMFYNKANGSLIRYNDQCIGSRLLAQGFTGAQYFHPRPSAADYNSTRSGGSNLGPLSKKLIDTTKERINKYCTENNLSPDALVPADAVTTSGSGLDPHISVENALLQAPRVADARGMSVMEMREKIDKHTEKPDLWVLGEERVNVLLLNLDLDGKDFND